MRNGPDVDGGSCDETLADCRVDLGGGGLLSRADSSLSEESECGPHRWYARARHAQRRYPRRADPEPGPVIESRVVEVGPLMLTAPNEWVRRQPEQPVSAHRVLASQSRWRCGRRPVDGEHRLGTLEDNLNRWKGQFGGKPDKESQETLDVGGVKVTWVDYSGTFRQRERSPRRLPNPGIGCWPP